MLSASPTSTSILPKSVCACAASSPVNKIIPTSSPSAPAAPLSLTNCNLPVPVSFVVFLITTKGSLAFAEVNVTVSCAIVPKLVMLVPTLAST